MNEKEFDEYKLQQFQTSIIALVSDSIDQIRLQMPGCITCDLLLDFESWYQDFLKIKATTLSDKQIALLNEIDKISNEIGEDSCLFIRSEDDIEKSDYKAIFESVDWEAIRKLAKEFLTSMGWEQKKLSPYTQISKNVWLRNE